MGVRSDKVNSRNDKRKSRIPEISVGYNGIGPNISGLFCNTFGTSALGRSFTGSRLKNRPIDDAGKASPDTRKLFI